MARSDCGERVSAPVVSLVAMTDIPDFVAIIRDAKGSVIRHLDVSREAGLHRETWNLRYGRSTPVSLASGCRQRTDVAGVAFKTPTFNSGERSGTWWRVLVKIPFYFDDTDA